jgi:DNA-binding NarL/FixJ family response regulator
LKDHDGKQSLLLVSSPGIIREATTVMLESMPQVGPVELAGGALSAIEQLQNGNSHLLVVDANLPVEETASLVRWSKQHRPDTRCIVLAKGMAELEQARAAGADAVLLRSSSSQQLAEALGPNGKEQ